MAVMEDLDIEMFLSPEQVAQQVDLSGEKYRFVRLLERESGEKTLLRIFDDSYIYPREGEISTAMKRLVTKAPKVVFLTGHGERDIQRAGDRDYYTFAIDPTFRHSLINQGFDVDSITLMGYRPIPMDIDVLVVGSARGIHSERREYCYWWGTGKIGFDESSYGFSGREFPARNFSTTDESLR